jgi:hypothetical protein
MRTPSCEKKVAFSLAVRTRRTTGAALPAKIVAVLVSENGINAEVESRKIGARRRTKGVDCVRLDPDRLRFNLSAD